ncbi:MAG: VWA domain-containing protein [Candidatus Omnitrophota bacterium]
MNFAHGIFIPVGVLTVSALIAFYLFAYFLKNRAMERFADKRLLGEINSALSIKKRRLKIIMVSAAVFLFFLALGRPQWGFEWKKTEHQGIDVIFAIDTSKSMLADDIKPNRLERVKLEIEYFMNNLAGDRVGIVAFAGNAFLQCPLTIDYNGFLLNLQTLDETAVPKEGTSIASAIKECIDTYERGGKKTKTVILITDGEDHEGKVIEAANKAKEKDIKIFCVGIGSKTGSPIPVIDEKKNKTMLKDAAGNIVKSRLDDSQLMKIAFITGGTYEHAEQTKFGLEQLYKNRLSKIKKDLMETKMEKRAKERFYFFLIPALMLLFLEPFINEQGNVSQRIF